MSESHEVVVVAGVRSPFARPHTDLAEVPAVELGRIVVRELVERAGIDLDAADEVIIGNVVGAADGSNIARAVSLRAKLGRRVPAFTVNRGGGSGLQSVIEAAYRIRSGDAGLIVAGSVESISGIPLLFSRQAQALWLAMGGSGGLFSRAAAAGRIRPRHFRPATGHIEGLIDPLSGARASGNAESLARKFGISREKQDEFAFRSHQRAEAAWSEGRMQGEVVPIPIPPRYERAAERDNGFEKATTLAALADMEPISDGRYGTVTPGNSSRLADGAVALLLASARRAKELSLPELGRIRSWAFAGCEPAQEGLGPLFSTPPALRRAGKLPLERMELIEINESSASEVLACLEAFGSRRFHEEQIGSGPLGTPDPERVNVNGGAIALGDPAGASGSRLILTALKELARRNGSLGLVTMSAGGGQGGSIVLERS